jgi:hypothetical protein
LINFKKKKKKGIKARCLWLRPVILDTWEAEIERITAGGQSWQKDQETPLPIFKIIRVK